MSTPLIERLPAPGHLYYGGQWRKSNRDFRIVVVNPATERVVGHSVEATAGDAHAAETPLDALVLAQLMHEAGVPAGVFNVVPGGRDIGEILVAHPEVDKVAFTGSTAAGRRVAAVCGNDIRRVSLELGGKSATIICEDADIPAAIQSLAADTFALSGQICSAITRLIVPERLEEEVLSGLLDLIEQLPVGDPLDPATVIGPLVSYRQLDRVQDYLLAGVREGARLYGGHLGKGKGWYIHPAVFTGVEPHMRIAREEIFGPVLSVLTYRGEEEAVALANASDYGLAAAVWSQGRAGALAMAKRLRAGTVHINGAPAPLDAPLGGYRQSGIGRELGIEGLHHYLEHKAIVTGGGV